MTNFSLRKLTLASFALRYPAVLFAACMLFFQSSAAAQNGYRPLSNKSLDKLVGPVALYPDPLLAQVLVAAGNPEQITMAAVLLKRTSSQAVIQDQPWDASVIAVAHYPSVIKLLNDSPDWTEQLGQAYANQGRDVMQAVQRQRALAQLQGNLSTSKQQNVVVEGSTILIVPATPDVIYVPVYDPVVVYTQPAPNPYTPLVVFGAGLAIGAWMNSDVNWNSSTVVYHTHGTGWGPAYYGKTAAYHSSGYNSNGGSYNSNAVAGRTVNGGAYGARSVSGNTAYGGNYNSNAAGGVTGGGTAWGARSTSGNTAAGGSFNSSAQANRNYDGSGSASRSASGETAAGGSWDYNAQANRNSNGSASASRSLTGTTANGNSYGGGSRATRNADGSGSYSRGYAGKDSGGAFGGAQKGSWGAAGSSSRGFSSRSAGGGGRGRR